MALYNTLPIETIISSFDNYVVIKKSEEFPMYKINQDIDILTTKLKKNIHIIVNSYDKNIFTHKIETVVDSKHYHIDIYLLSNLKQLHFRFDLFSWLNYTKFLINENIINYIILNRIKCSSVYIPKLEDDLSLRYAEYIEFKHNPKKQKHLDYTNKFASTKFFRIKEGDTNSLLNYKTGENPYYGFIIWSHGIQHIYNIIELLKQSILCRIILIERKKFDDVSDFINKIYALEMHNKQHIIGKTNYLRKLGTDYFYILIQKFDYNPKQYGTGKDMIYADEDVVNFKWLIRKLYNPKLLDSNAQPSPSLPPGISHHHVLHATDTEKETMHLTNVITNRQHSFYKDNKIQEYLIPYHIRGLFSLKEVSISDLKITIHKTTNNDINNTKRELVSIQDTPHYAYVNGDKSVYINYYKQFLGRVFTEDHTGYSFDRLILSFNPHTYKYESTNLILIKRNNEVLDGVHRLAILINYNITKIKVLSL